MKKTGGRGDSDPLQKRADVKSKCRMRPGRSPCLLPDETCTANLYRLKKKAFGTGKKLSRAISGFEAPRKRDIFDYRDKILFLSSA